MRKNKQANQPVDDIACKKEQAVVELDDLVHEDHQAIQPADDFLFNLNEITSKTGCTNTVPQKNSKES